MVGDTAGEWDTPLWLVRHQPFGILCLIRGFSYSDVAKQKHRPAWLNTGLWPWLSFCGGGTQQFGVGQISGWKARATMLLRVVAGAG